MAGILGLALVIRLVILGSSLSRLDGDEAITGIMAQRINEGHHLAFFAGQAYQGSGEQYIQALLFRVLPETPFTLRLPQVVLSVLGCLGVYHLALRCWRSRGRAFLAAGLFAVGPFFSLWWSVKSRGAYGTGLVLGLSGLLVALWIHPPDRRVGIKMGLFGLICGLGFWANWQAAYLLAPAAIWLAGTLRWRILRFVPGAVVGFVIGAAPSIAHLILTGPLEASGSYVPTTLPHRAKLFLTSVLPQFVGVQFGGDHRLVSWLRPTVATVVVGLALAFALWLRRRGLLDLALFRDRHRAPIDLLLLCTVIAPLLYIQAGAAAGNFPGYLFPLYSVAPVLLAGVPLPAPARRTRWLPPVVATALVGLFATQSWHSAHQLWARGADVLPVVSGERIPTEDFPAAIDALVAQGVRSAFADYWIANPMQFLAGNRLVISSSYTYRFPDLTAVARADPSPALIVPAGARADAMRRAITAAGSTAREQPVRHLVLFTDIRPGLAPAEAFIMDTVLQPAPLDPLRR